MSGEYIFFYSNYVEASKQLQEKLIKHYDLYKQFHLINVNDKRLKIPKIITHIPAFIITENGVTNVLFEPDASHWIRDRTQQTHQSGPASNGGGGQDSIGDWDPSAMSGFSDNFSSLENGGGMNKDFAFVGQTDQRIYTPDADPVGGGQGGQQQQQPQQSQQPQGIGGVNTMSHQGGFSGISSGGGFHGGQGSRANVQKSKSEQDFERLMAQRRNDIPRAVNRQ